MSRPLPESVPRLRPGYRLSEAPGQGSVLLIPEGVLQLSGPGPRILELCDGLRSFADVLRKLQAAFPDADRARIEEEAGAFLERLRERRAVDY